MASDIMPAPLDIHATALVVVDIPAKTLGTGLHVCTTALAVAGTIPAALDIHATACGMELHVCTTALAVAGIHAAG